MVAVRQTIRAMAAVAAVLEQETAAIMAEAVRAVKTTHLVQVEQVLKVR